MGFYIRKSIKAGPFRFNFSKSGVGVSAGVKGFRVGSGPAGNYIHMGRGGLYYRKTFKPSSKDKLSPAPKDVPQKYQGMASNPEYANFTEIESGDVTQIADSSSAELLTEFDTKRKKIRLWPVTSVLFVGAFFIVPQGSADWLYLLIASLGLALIYAAYRYDQIRKTVILFYEMEPEFEMAYENFHRAFSILGTARKKWHVEAKADVRDRKRNAGASEVISRQVIELTTKKAPYIKTNIKVPAVPVGKQVLYFFPDRVLVFERSGVGAVSYENLDIDIRPSRFIESGSVPSDAQVVDHTWRFVNKNGGPDRRFNNNRQLPICLYEDMHMTSNTGLNELVSFSKGGLAQSFVDALIGLSGVLEGDVPSGTLLEEVA